MDVCDAEVPQQVSSVETAKRFSRMVAEAPYDIIVPTTEAMVARLPTRPTDGVKDHQPFPDDLPTIAGFGSTITLLPSLQRPRKMDVIGSNGRRYTFLCKPDDDMRKDTRIMDFNSMINKLLQADADARQRQLCIRTYAVVPLNEECGIIEWVGCLEVGGGGWVGGHTPLHTRRRRAIECGRWPDATSRLPFAPVIRCPRRLGFATLSTTSIASAALSGARAMSSPS